MNLVKTCDETRCIKQTAHCEASATRKLTGNGGANIHPPHQKLHSNTFYQCTDCLKRCGSGIGRLGSRFISVTVIQREVKSSDEQTR